MRGINGFARVAFIMAALGMVLILGGCPKHENFPTQLDVVEAPAPSQFQVAWKGTNANSEFLYDLTWTISDDTNVDHYRLYLIGAGFVPELVHETDATETDAHILPIKLPGSAAGLQFGLSSVSTGFIESSMTAATVPDTLSTN